MFEALSIAVALIVSGDSSLIEIVLLSLRISLTAVVLAALVALPLGAWLGSSEFAGRRFLIAVITALMGLPPVVVGLLVYLLVSNSGPLGTFQLLYTPAAMIFAQTVLVLPIIATLARQTIEDLHQEYDEFFASLGLTTRFRAATLLWEARGSLMTALLAGFGRAIAEVGAVIIVGGNINHVTRTMTTAIALETSKGDLPLALALGIILIALAMVITLLAQSARVPLQRIAV